MIRRRRNLGPGEGIVIGLVLSAPIWLALYVVARWVLR